MKHRLTVYNMRLHFVKKSDRSHQPHDRSLAHLGIINDARHTIMQGSRDLARRGQSNREGANNRRYRRYVASLSNSVKSITWPDYFLNDFEKRSRDYATGCVHYPG